MKSSILCIDSYISVLCRQELCSRASSSRTGKWATGAAHDRERLRAMLDEFFRHCDSTRVLFEDDMWLAGVILMKSEAQGRVFEESGECLLLVLTHNINTLR